MTDNFKMFESKKFMWDGSLYDSEEQAKDVKSNYEGEGFETQLLEEEGKYLVYSRRVVTDVVVEGQP